MQCRKIIRCKSGTSDKYPMNKANRPPSTAVSKTVGKTIAYFFLVSCQLEGYPSVTFFWGGGYSRKSEVNDIWCIKMMWTENGWCCLDADVFLQFGWTAVGIFAEIMAGLHQNYWWTEWRNVCHRSVKRETYRSFNFGEYWFLPEDCALLSV